LVMARLYLMLRHLVLLGMLLLVVVNIEASVIVRSYSEGAFTGSASFISLELNKTLLASRIQQGDSFWVGLGSELVELWFIIQQSAISSANFFEISIFAAADMVMCSRDVDGQDTVSVKLSWMDVEELDLHDWEEGNVPTLVLGTDFQLMDLMMQDKLEPLHSLFDDWYSEAGLMLKDDLLRFYEYSYKGRHEWLAVPLTSETRVLLYNRTTFQNLGLLPPPPHRGQSSWSWTKVVEVAETITERTLGPGFSAWGGWDEEWKISLLLALAVQSPLLKSDKSYLNGCGLGPEFAAMVDATLGSLMRAEALGPSEGAIDRTSTAFLDWLQGDLVEYSAGESSVTAVANVNFPGNYLEELHLHGMTLGNPETLLRPLFDKVQGNLSHLEQCLGDAGCEDTDLGIGWAPGGWSSLGGSGVGLVKGSEEPKLQLGEQLVSAMLRRASDYGEAVFSPPPLESVWEQSPWISAAWDTVRYQLKHAVPLHYPLYWSPELSRIKATSPFRKMWMEMVYKNVSTSKAVDRVCTIIESLINTDCSTLDSENIPKFSSCKICNDSDYDFTVSPCGNKPHDGKHGSMSQRYITFFLRDDIPACVEQKNHPTFLTIDCEYTRFEGPGGILSACFIFFGALVAFVYLVWIFWNRNIPIVKSTQAPLTYISCTSALAANLSVLLILGKPTPVKCALFFWGFNLSFTLLLGSLHAKIRRIQIVFNTSGQQLSKKKVPIRRVLPLFGFLVLVEVAFLSSYTIKENSKVVFTSAPGLPPEIGYSSCNWNAQTIGLEMSLKGLVLLLACCTAWKVRSVSSVFSEARELLMASYNLALVCTAVALILILYESNWVVVCAVGSCIATGPAMLLLLVPKLTKRRMTRTEVANELRRDSISLASHSSVLSIASYPQVTIYGDHGGTIRTRTRRESVESSKSCTRKTYCMDSRSNSFSDLNSARDLSIPPRSPNEETRPLFQGSSIFKVNDSELSKYLLQQKNNQRSKDPPNTEQGRQDESSPLKTVSPSAYEIGGCASLVDDLEAKNRSLEEELEALKKKCQQLSGRGNIVSKSDEQRRHSLPTPDTVKRASSERVKLRPPPINMASLKRQASDVLSNGAQSVKSMLTPNMKDSKNKDSAVQHLLCHFSANSTEHGDLELDDLFPGNDEDYILTARIPATQRTCCLSPDDKEMEFMLQEKSSRGNTINPPLSITNHTSLKELPSMETGKPSTPPFKMMMKPSISRDSLSSQLENAELEDSRKAPSPIQIGLVETYCSKTSRTPSPILIGIAQDHTQSTKPTVCSALDQEEADWPSHSNESPTTLQMHSVDAL